MTDDFESNLKLLLNEQVDHELGARRPAPQFRAEQGPARTAAASGPVRSHTRRRAPWVTPLLAAACVAVVAAGAVVSTQVLSSSRHEPPATVVPAPPTPTAAPTVPPGTSVLDGADIAVPRGWQVVRHDFDDSVHQWCLRAPGISTDDCTLTVSHVATYATNTGGQADTLEAQTLGVSGDPSLAQSCDGQPPPTTATYRYATFGGRKALRAEFVRRCAGKELTHYVQYVVTTAPMWFVVLGVRSGPLPAGGLAALATVAGRSVLPAQTGALPVTSVAQVRAVGAESAGMVRVTLREIVERYDSQTAIALTGASYTCDLPLTGGSGGTQKAPKVGDRLSVRSDGRTVTEWNVRGS